MGFATEASIFSAYAAGLLIVYFFGKIFAFPVKILLKLLSNGVIGGLLLIVINFVGSFVGIFIPVNVITVFVSGLLGIPGIAVLLIYYCLF